MNLELKEKRIHYFLILEFKLLFVFLYKHKVAYDTVANSKQVMFYEESVSNLMATYEYAPVICRRMTLFHVTVSHFLEGIPLGVVYINQFHSLTWKNSKRKKVVRAFVR